MDAITQIIHGVLVGLILYLVRKLLHVETKLAKIETALKIGLGLDLPENGE